MKLTIGEALENSEKKDNYNSKHTRDFCSTLMRFCMFQRAIIILVT